jgi:hypothetical protein
LGTRSAFRSLAAALALISGLARGRLDAPDLVTDAPGLLGPEQERSIARHNELLRRDHDIDYRVDVVGDAGDLLTYGVQRFSELAVTRTQDAEKRDAFQAPSRAGAAGGGAETRAGFGAGPDRVHRSGPEVAARATPLETVDAYLDAMRTRIGSPDLDLYTEETRGILQDWVVNAAQMDAVARA